MILHGPSLPSCLFRSTSRFSSLKLRLYFSTFRPTALIRSWPTMKAKARLHLLVSPEYQIYVMKSSALRRQHPLRRVTVHFQSPAPSDTARQAPRTLARSTRYPLPHMARASLPSHRDFRQTGSQAATSAL